MSSTPVPNTTFNVFDSFAEYQVKILFQGWYTATVWQFALSCLGLFTFSVIYHLLRWLRCNVEKWIRQTSARMTDKFVAEETVRLVQQQSMNFPTHREGHICGLYVALYVLSVLQTAIWLLISMANMTFNPWVFISIVLGYSIGDISVHAKISRIRTE